MIPNRFPRSKGHLREKCESYPLGGGVHPFFRAKCYNGKHLPSTNKKSPEELRDVAHLMLMKASSPPVRSSNSRVSSVSTSAQIWEIFLLPRANVKGNWYIKLLKALLHLLAHHVFSLAIIIPLAYKRLRKWWNETIVPRFFPRLSSSVFSCLQASFDLEEDEYSTIYLYFSLRHFQEFHLMYIYRRLYNICTIYSTNLTEVRKDGSKSTFGLTFFEGNNKDSDIHPTFKKKLTLKPKKKVMSSHEEWSPLRESLCLGVPCHNQPDMQSGKLNRFAAPETVKVGRSRSGFLLGWVLVTFQGWNC